MIQPGGSERPLTNGDVSAVVFRSFLDITQTPTQLRANLDYHFSPGALADASLKSVVGIADGMTAKLYGMGLDLDNDADPRIRGFQRGIEAVKSADPELYDTPGPHPTRRPETTLYSSYNRILSAIDTTSDTRLVLRPQMPLVAAELLPVIAETALEITADPAYETPSSYPRRANRVITDVESPFWHYAIHTDDHPGKQFGRDGRGPNVQISIPTGAITDESVMRLHQNDHLGNDVWNGTRAAGYVPASAVVQQVRMGVPQHGSDSVDTLNHSVVTFLERTARREI